MGMCWRYGYFPADMMWRLQPNADKTLAHCSSAAGNKLHQALQLCGLSSCKFKVIFIPLSYQVPGFCYTGFGGMLSLDAMCLHLVPHLPAKPSYGDQNAPAAIHVLLTFQKSHT
jgi:hypothetical protein